MRAFSNLLGRRPILAALLAALPLAALAADAPPAWKAHLDRGRAEAKRRAWSTAAAEFTESIRLAPRESSPLIDRGNALGELGRFTDARADFARAAEVDPTNPEPFYRVALACVALRDDAAYRAACTVVVDRFGANPDPTVAGPIAYTCTARPDAIADPARLVPIGEHAVPLFKGNERVLGATLYRAGRPAEAARHLEASSRSTTPVAWDWLFLSMAHHRLSHPDLASTYLTQARLWITSAESPHPTTSPPTTPRTTWHSWNERAEVLALLREAEALIPRSPGPL